MKKTPLELASPSCGGCSYFVPSDEVETQASGMCHRYPPTVVVDADGDIVRARPQMEATESCGEFKAKQ